MRYKPHILIRTLHPTMRYKPRILIRTLHPTMRYKPRILIRTLHPTMHCNRTLKSELCILPLKLCANRHMVAWMLSRHFKHTLHHTNVEWEKHENLGFLRTTITKPEQSSAPVAKSLPLQLNIRFLNK